MQITRETLRRAGDARSFVRGLMQTTIKLRPDPVAGERRIELHGQANPGHDGDVAHQCEELNTTETHYPGTNFRPSMQSIEVVCHLAGMIRTFANG